MTMFSTVPTQERRGEQVECTTFSGNNAEGTHTTLVPNPLGELGQMTSTDPKESGKCSPYQAATCPEKTQMVEVIIKRRK